MNNLSLNKIDSVGVVVIGRNESKRLLLCLQSIRSSGCPVVYVDSGSTDLSVSIAQPMVDIVHQLDPAKPFSAARARNEGVEQLCALFKEVELIQFIDGDCVLSEGWLQAASASLQCLPERAVVTGHLLECNPHLSIYNKLCEMEWKSAPGDFKNFGALGGIFMVRANVFKALNGFNAKVIAGEDSEFGVRLSLLGHKITKIDHVMATHDANMTTFAQWWTRAVRAGHAIGQRAHLNGKTIVKDCVQERKSTLFWGILIPMLVLILLIPSQGYSLILLLAYVVLAFKIFLFRRKQQDNNNDALIYAKFTVIGKVANGLGLLKFYFNKFKQRYEIIEYK